LPTVFSRSRSLFSSGSFLLLLSLVSIFDIESSSYFVMNFNEVYSIIHG
jgi:hypothetical protein